MAAGTQPCQQPTDCNIFEDSSGIIKSFEITVEAMWQWNEALANILVTKDLQWDYMDIKQIMEKKENAEY